MFEILSSLTEKPVGDELRRLERFRGTLHLEELAQTVREDLPGAASARRRRTPC